MAGNPPRRIIIGIGNPDRGDDGAGRAAARRLCGVLPQGVVVVEHDGETTGLLAELDGAATAYLVDACVSGAPAGTVYRYDVAKTQLSHVARGASSHGLGLAEAVELARILGQLPPSCIVYAIEGETFAFGTVLSPPVATAVDDVVARICGEIAGQFPARGASGCMKPL
jgi:hydrogenase maturation protease